MATRDLAIPPGRVAWPARVALPLLGILVAGVAATSLGVALARLPADVAAPGRPVTLAAVRVPETLDPIAAAPAGSWPRSEHPIGGLAFVRCTNLWTSNADASNARRILTMPGIASPTFSPDGRTIAFLATGAFGTQIWMTSADGSARRLLGTLREDGAPVLADVGPVEWAPDGTRLALGIVTPGTRASTTTHWIVDLPSGAFERVEPGGAAFTWLGRQVLAAGRDDGDVRQLWGSKWTARRMSNDGAVDRLAFAQGWWAWEWQKHTALLLHDGAGDLRLEWRTGPTHARRPVTTEAPNGYTFDPSARLAVVQHGPVAATLVDASGERDLGLFDPVSGGWQVLDYAWDAAASPAPPALGGVERQRAVELAQTILWHLRQPERVELLLASPVEHGVAPFRHMGSTFEQPVRRDGGWSIRAHAFGRLGEGFGARSLRVEVRNVGGRLAGTVVPAGPLVRIRTVDDAVRFLGRTLTVRVLAPAGLPEGTTLAARALDAWSWRGRTTGSLNVIAPGFGRLTFYYGSGSLGCGSYPIPVDLSSGTPAIMQDPEMSGGYNAVAWPAEPKDASGPFGVSGRVPPAVLVAIAGATDANRRSA